MTPPEQQPMVVRDELIIMLHERQTRRILCEQLYKEAYSTTWDLKLLSSHVHGNENLL